MNSKTILRTLLLLTLVSFAFGKVNAQSPSVTDAFITMDSISATSYAGTYIIVLSDTNNISELEVKLGSDPGAGDLMNNTYTYDVTSGLPGGWSYSRVGNTITLGIGTYTEKNIYFGNVRAKVSGTWSDSYQFVSN